MVDASREIRILDDCCNNLVGFRDATFRRGHAQLRANIRKQRHLYMCARQFRAAIRAAAKKLRASDPRVFAREIGNLWIISRGENIRDENVGNVARSLTLLSSE